MKESDRTAELKSFFPFNCCGEDLRTKALGLGKCVKYEAGEPVLLSGSPARHCGLIIDGQAVAFKLDGTGRRYQLCLEEGCFVGLETLTPENNYTAKITALSDLYIVFWNDAGMASLMESDPDFRDAMRMLDEGRTYQEQWLVPETDITDPVLCSLQMHWLSAAAPAFWILPLLLVGLTACGRLIRNYPAAWLLAIVMTAAAGSLLYRMLTNRLNERVIATSKNLILIPGKIEEEMAVIRLSQLQSIALDQNLFGRLIDSGKIIFDSDERRSVSPPVRCPLLAASLIRGFAEKASSGRPVLMDTGRKLRQQPSVKDHDVQQPQAAPTLPAEPVPFRKTEFRAHWALLLRNIAGPFLFLFAALLGAYIFRNNINADFIQAVFFLAAALACISVFFKIVEWRNNCFTIEEDRVRDYNKKPFSREGLNTAMLRNIQSVRFEKDGFWQVLLNYGTVFILAGEGELTFDYVSDPEKVQSCIMDACARYESQSRMEEEARRRAYISHLVREIQSETSGENVRNP